ncbi:NUC173-domain-containing protein [Hesseltinella vesiculosa]|uniref:NUC173-domain-containing protein n=1 Tax=Hesseltinella vesiculosa TaxID=101127 RepID=A0A1X2GJY2_9FUNG|nr:NUC173-domain-containing protein [Hesseltinella vesiculosa]
MEQSLDKIRKHLQSKLENQKLHAQTLLAIEEITTIQSSQDNEALTGALLYLLAAVLKHVPTSVLRSKFSTVMPMFEAIYEQHSHDQPMVRAIVECMASFLLAQDAHLWSMPATKKYYQTLLILSANATPKARKDAQEAVQSILANPPPPTTVHPASSMTAEFILKVLHEATKSNQQAAQQILALLQSIVQYWPPFQFTALCQTLLQLPRYNNIYLTKAAFDVFEALFDAQEHDLDSEKLSDLLTALCELKPAAHDERLLPTWLLMISKAYPAYAKLNPVLCANGLATIFELVFRDFEKDSRNYTQMANCLSTLLEYCITDELIQQAMMGTPNSLTTVLEYLQAGLGIHTQPAWKQVMMIQEALFRKLHRNASPLMDRCVVLLGEIRLTPGPSYKEQLDKTLGAAITAMGPEAFLTLLPLNLEGGQGVGRAFLLPLLKTYITNTNMTFFVDELMPLGDRLAEKAQRASADELTLQAKVYETLVHQIWSLAPGFCQLPLDLPQAFTEQVAERFSALLYSQPDLRPTVTQALQLLVEKNEQLAKSQSDDIYLLKAYGLTKQDGQDNLELMGKFAVNYLAVFFNVYSQIPSANRGFMSDVIKTYLTVTTPQDINTTFKKVLGLLSSALESNEPQIVQDTNVPPPMAQTMLDLAIIMIPFLDVESAQLLYNGTMTSLLDKEDAPLLQKKGYKILNHLMAHANGRQVILANLGQLQTRLLDATATCTPSARKDRIKTFMHVVRLLNSSELQFIPCILSEVVISLKEGNEKCRGFAFSTLVDMGNRMKEGGMIKTSQLPGMPADAPDAPASLREFFTMVTAGLAGTTSQMVGATVTALSRVFFEFKDDLSGEVASELLQTMNTLVASNNREVVKAALGYVKVCIVVLDAAILAPQLDMIVQHLLSCSHQHRVFKLKLRHVLERLIRRFGYDSIAHLVPEEDKKLISNIQKRRLRAKRQKKERQAGDDEDDEMDDAIAHAHTAKKVTGFHDAYEEVVYGSESELESDDESALPSNNAGSKKKTQGGNTFIREHMDNGGVLDLLDRSALAQITSSKPTQRRAASGKQAFLQDDTGRLVIDNKTKAADSDDDQEEPQEDYYMEAVRNVDGFVRDRRNRIKFKKGGKNDMEEDQDMDVDGGSKKKLKPKYERLGKEFRTKRAGGDVKRKGQSDPFAYVPLGKVIKKKGKQPNKVTYTGRIKK